RLHRQEGQGREGIRRHRARARSRAVARTVGAGAGEAGERGRDPQGPRGQGEGAQISLYLRWSRTAIQWIAVLTLAVMVAINAAEIGHRVLFTRGLNWVQELSIILAMTLYFFVYALIAKDREYIRIELFSRLLGPRGKRVLAIATRVVVLTFQALVAWFALRSAQFA